MRALAVIGMTALFAACVSPEQARHDSFVETRNGEAIYSYTVQHWPTALASRSKLEHWIRRDGEKLCPQGYREISRTPGDSHVYYSGPVPMPYNDVHIRIACAVQ